MDADIAFLAIVALLGWWRVIVERRHEDAEVERQRRRRDFGRNL